jgi:Zn-dependent peptidase ImmA (M78 family)
VAIHLEIDPKRLKALRTRLNRPLHVAAELAKVNEEELAMWEETPTPLPLDKCQSIAKSYNRNWYIFLLEDEIGKPTVPHDFRKGRGEAVALGHESMLAFDNAALLLDKIESLNASTSGRSVIDELPAKLSDDPEVSAKKFRNHLSVPGQPESPHAYAVLRFWRFRLSDAGLFVAQAKFPTSEMRAFCRSSDGHHLIVVSNQDPAAARTFSLLHEVGHLLLGGDAMCKPTGWMNGHSEEPWCNRFAAAVLLPKAEVQASPRYHDLISGEVTIGSGRALAREFGVSELAVFRRLETFGDLTNAQYKELQDASDDGWEPSKGPDKGWMEHPKRIVYSESPLFVRQVFEAFSAGEISYREIGSMLNAPLHSVSGVREEAY